jgi:chemotaxis protein histidine kinase CheA
MRGLDPARPQDLEVIGREAHTLKGDAGSFGLLHAHACALAIEKAARGGGLADYEAQLAALKVALDAGLAQVPRPAKAA